MHRHWRAINQFKYCLFCCIISSWVEKVKWLGIRSGQNTLSAVSFVFIKYVCLWYVTAFLRHIQTFKTKHRSRMGFYSWLCPRHVFAAIKAECFDVTNILHLIKKKHGTVRNWYETIILMQFTKPQNILMHPNVKMLAVKIHFTHKKHKHIYQKPESDRTAPGWRQKDNTGIEKWEEKKKPANGKRHGEWVRKMVTEKSGNYSFTFNTRQ